MTIEDNTIYKTDRGYFDVGEYSTEVVFLPGLAPANLGLSYLIGHLAKWLMAANSLSAVHVSVHNFANHFSTIFPFINYV